MQPYFYQKYQKQFFLKPEHIPVETTFCRKFLVSKIDYGTFRGLFERSEFRRNVLLIIDEANLELIVPLSMQEYVPEEKRKNCFIKKRII